MLTHLSHNGRVPFLLLVIVAADMTLFASAQNGLDPKREPAHYTHQSWRVRDGLPQSSVNALAQTPDGYLWIGTQEGLSRFNGSAFRTFNKSIVPQLRSNFVRLLAAGRGGTLWIATTAPGLIAYRRGEFARVGDSLDAQFVTALSADEAGALWIGTDRGMLFRKREDSVSFVRWNGETTAPILTILPLGTDSVLVGTSREIRLWTPAGPVAVHLPVKAKLMVRVLVTDGNGTLWIGTIKDGVWSVKGNEVRHFGAAEGLASSRVECMSVDSRGTVWVGLNGGGVARIRNGRVSGFDTRDGLTARDVLSLLEDREGNLWIGTSAGGLDRLSNGKFVTLATGSDPAALTVFAVHEGRNGSIWAGNSAGEVLRFDGVAFRPYVSLPESARSLISALYQGADGLLWVGAREGLFLLEKGKLRPVPRPGGKPWGVVFAISEDARGNVWIASGYGLTKFRGGEFHVRNFPAAAGPPTLRSLQLDARGTLWGVAWESGLWSISGDSVRNYTTADGLPTTELMSLSVDREGVLWIGSVGAGLIRFKDGRFDRFPGARGLSDDNIYTILEDDSARLWMSSNNGVFVASREQLSAVADGRDSGVSCVFFGEEDGIRSRECNGLGQNSGLRSRDGRLWFATVMGVAVVDPNNLPHNTVPPPVVVEEVMVEYTALPATADLTAPPGTQRIEFRYAGLSLSNPSKVFFRYRLDGFDRDWVDAGTRRTAYYTNLPPGKYVFRVTASNDDGMWNSTGAALGIQLDPQFYQTTWFLVLCLVAAAAGGYRSFVLYRRYHERKLRSSQLETLLTRSRLQALSMQLQPHFLFNTLHAVLVLVKEDPATAARMITGLSELLRMTLDDSDQELVPLAREMEFLRKYLEIQQVRFQDRLNVRIETDENLLAAMVPTLVLQPIVENAITHGIARLSGPGEIAVKARTRGTMLELEVSDNGSGMAEGARSVLNPGRGISNTRTRLHHLYGEEHSFEMTGSPQGGVTVKIVLPLRFASAGTTMLTELGDAERT